jgi:hypothetical protein
MRWTLLCTTRKCQGILLQICTVRESLSISFGMLTGSRAGHRDCRHVNRLVCVLQRVQIGRGPIQCSMKWVLGRGGGGGSVFLGVKREGHGALQAPLLSTEV